MELTPCKKVQWCLRGGTVVHASEPVRGIVTQLKELSMCRMGATLTCSQGWLSVELCHPSTWPHRWKWGIFGDQMTMTYRGATEQRNSLHVPTCWKWKWRGRTHRLSAAGRGHGTGTVYTVSICIWHFVKPFIKLLRKSPLLFSYPKEYNTICHLVTVEPDG